jgi:hypothetical protein
LDDKKIIPILRNLQKGKISFKDTLSLFKDFPYSDIGFAKLDTHRSLRKGFPEVIYAPGKTLEQLKRILERIRYSREPILVTKLKPSVYNKISAIFPELKFNPEAGIAYIKSKNAKKLKGRVVVVTAGTGDIPVAEEAVLTLEVMGSRVVRLYDVGVAGVHRLLDKIKILKTAKVIIVVAGMEGALASVISGLIRQPVIAVPTSVGYGANFKGIATLLSMLNCCSPGVTVVNIDNGFGAGYFAHLINK